MSAKRGEPAVVGQAPLLELIGDVCGLLDLEEHRWGLISSLQRVIPSDYVSFNDVGPNPGEAISIAVPDFDTTLFSVWERLAFQNPLLRQYLETMDGRAYRFSDIVSTEELHALELYKELYAPLGIEYQMAFILPAPEDHVLGVALCRCDRDYTDAERDLANEARPFLIQLYANAVAYSRLRALYVTPAEEELIAVLTDAGLTRREGQVLSLAALGRSNQHIARDLRISDRTVGKHLEHGFRKLGVRDRSSAAQQVWALAHAAAERSWAMTVTATAAPIPAPDPLTR
jgi:DNA-binding CsgD family transcriptional regulator